MQEKTISTPEKQRQIVQKLDAMHALNITTIDVRPATSLTDTIIIASAKSQRHARSLLDSMLELKASLDEPAPRIEGEEFSQWILVDYHDVIIHIMLEDVREYYALEKLWDAALNLPSTT